MWTFTPSKLKCSTFEAHLCRLTYSIKVNNTCINKEPYSNCFPEELSVRAAMYFNSREQWVFQMAAPSRLPALVAGKQWRQSKQAPCLAVSGHCLFSERIFWDCNGDASLLCIQTCCGYSRIFLRHSSPWTRDHSCFHEEAPVALKKTGFWWA